MGEDYHQDKLIVLRQLLYMGGHYRCCIEALSCQTKAYCVPGCRSMSTGGTLSLCC